MKNKFFILIYCLFYSFYAQAYGDSTDMQKDKDTIVYAWKLNFDLSDIVEVDIDTNLNQFQNYNPARKNGYTSAFNGNIVSPATSHYFRRNYDIHFDFFFIKNYHAYLYHYYNTYYYNTKKPYSNISFIASLNEKQKVEQNIKVTHTQNVNKNLNLGIIYDLTSAKGQYRYQKHKRGSFVFFSSLNKKKYELYSSLNINSLKIQKNGGLYYDEFMEVEEIQTENLNTKLGGNYGLGKANANENYVNKGLLIHHKYKFGRKRVFSNRIDTVQVNDTVLLDTVKVSSLAFDDKWYINHRLIYEDNKRTFTDVNPDIYYYNNIYDNKIDVTEDGSSYSYMPTYDSSFFRKFENSLYLGFNNNTILDLNFKGNVGLSYQIRKYSYLHHNFPLFGDSVYNADMYSFKVNATTDSVQDKVLHDFNFKMNLFNNDYDNYDWYFYANYCFSGFNEGDYDFKLNMSKWFNDNKKRVTVFSRFKSKKPDFFMMNYSSNHTQWFISDFSKIVRRLGGLSFQNVKRNFNIGFYFEDDDNLIYFTEKAYIDQDNNFLNKTKPLYYDSVNNNYFDLDNNIYEDTLMFRPVQDERGTNVFALFVEKKFNVWKIHSLNRLTWQNIMNKSVVRLPEFLFYNTTYIDHTFHFRNTGGELGFQFGFDIYYNSDYYVYSYTPVINQFYLQDDVKLGNYPYIDLFINLRIKRARLFIKYEHANQGAMGREYAYLYFYPMNVSTFKLGLSWNFYK